jgi:putative methionine-R-sulfoxide reductase with GAF domain
MYEGIPAEFRELFERWVEIGIVDTESHSFCEFEVIDETFHMTLYKKPHRHMGHLERDYRRFLKEIVVPISSVILYCEIEHDDYGDARYEYTDEEIRSPSFG